MANMTNGALVFFNNLVKMHGYIQDKFLFKVLFVLEVLLVCTIPEVSICALCHHECSMDFLNSVTYTVVFCSFHSQSP